MSAPKLRYRVGFENESTKAECLLRNPGYFAVVDMQTCWALGDIIALVPDKEMAYRITLLLNGGISSRNTSL